MATLADDQGWDDEIVPVSSKGYTSLKTNYIDYGLVTYSKGNTYIFLSALNKWSPLISAEAQRQLCDITGGENASVSYLNASLPYFGYVEKHASRTGAIPISICIGTKRFRISQVDNRMEFVECIDIVSVKDNLDQRVSGFCVMPFSFSKIPVSWSPSGTEKMLRYIKVLFNDQSELKSIQWVLGLASVDPGFVSKFLLLYGPGGTGKSTIIGIIEDIFNGCCGAISSTVLTSKNSTINTDVARTIASNRLVSAGDINLETSQLNLHTIKEITGQDSVSVPPIKVRTRCSLVAASNDLPHPSTQKTWCSPAISRRMIVVPMNVKTSLIPNVQRPDSVQDCIDFLMSCIDIYLEDMLSPPMSMRSLMYTILGSGYSELQGRILFTEDATIQDIFDANTGIEVYFGLPLHILGELAYLVAPKLVIEEGSIYFINNIKLLSEDA